MIETTLCHKIRQRETIKWDVNPHVRKAQKVVGFVLNIAGRNYDTTQTTIMGGKTGCSYNDYRGYNVPTCTELSELEV